MLRPGSHSYVPVVQEDPSFRECHPIHSVPLDLDLPMIHLSQVILSSPSTQGVPSSQDDLRKGRGGERGRGERGSEGATRFNHRYKNTYLFVSLTTEWNSLLVPHPHSYWDL